MVIRLSPTGNLPAPLPAAATNRSASLAHHSLPLSGTLLRILYCTTVGLDAGDLAGGRARIVSLPNPIVADIEGRVVITSPWAGAPGTSAGPPGVMLAPLAAAAPAGPAPGGLLRAV